MTTVLFFVAPVVGVLALIMGLRALGKSRNIPLINVRKVKID